jgi:hypothetical protein
LKQTGRLAEAPPKKQISLAIDQLAATRNGHICRAAIPDRLCSAVGKSLCQLLIGDPSKITQISEWRKEPISLGNGSDATMITNEILGI